MLYPRRRNRAPLGTGEAGVHRARGRQVRYLDVQLHCGALQQAGAYGRLLFFRSPRFSSKLDLQLLDTINDGTCFNLMLGWCALLPLTPAPSHFGPKRVAKPVLGAPYFEKQKIAENFPLESSSRDCCRRFRMSAAAGPKRFSIRPPGNHGIPDRAL